MKYLLLIFFLLPFSSLSKKPSHLEELFKNYKEDISIPIRSEIFLSSLKKYIKTKGHLDISKEKFHMRLEGDPGSLYLFDGESLFIQSDLTEKTIFQIKDPEGLEKLQVFFNEQAFFKHFEVKKKGKKRIFLYLYPQT